MMPNLKYSTLSASTIDRDGDENGEGLPSLDVEVAFVKGQIQEPEFRDKWFAILFLLHLGTVLVVAGLYASGALKTDNPNDKDLMQRMLDTLDPYSEETSLDKSNTDYYLQEQRQQDQSESSVDEFSFPYIRVLFLILLVSPRMSILAWRIMARNGTKLIRFCMCIAIGFHILLIMFCLLFFWPLCIIPAFFACVLTWYMKIVWHRIPYAAANLKVAVNCIEDNAGMAYLAMSTIPLKLIWLWIWVYTSFHVVNSPWMKSQETQVEATDDMNGAPNTHENSSLSSRGILALLALTLSLYWTCQVITNVVQTTVAGTVGTWWFAPQEANEYSSRGLTDSLSRSLTYSFGSICLGSLLVAIIEVLQGMLGGISRNRKAGILRCIAECLLILIDALAQFFNKWAFVYVGLYGYSYVEAARNVLSLFTNHGWTAIISDQLVRCMLFVIVYCIGLVNAFFTGCLTIGLVVEISDLILILLASFFAGVAVSASILHVLINAVDAIIVLYTESPAEFKDNYPELAAELETAWSQAWTDIFTPDSRSVEVTDALV